MSRRILFGLNLDKQSVRLLIEQIVKEGATGMLHYFDQTRRNMKKITATLPELLFSPFWDEYQANVSSMAKLSNNIYSLYTCRLCHLYVYEAANDYFTIRKEILFPVLMSHIYFCFLLTSMGFLTGL